MVFFLLRAIEITKWFTQYRLDNVCRLNSQCSIRVYELMKQYALEFSPPPTTRLMPKPTSNILGSPLIKESRRALVIQFYDITIPKSDNTIALESSETTPVPVYANPESVAPLKPSLPEEIINLIPENHRNNKGLIDTLSFHSRQPGQRFIQDALGYANRQELKNYPAYVTVFLRNSFIKESEPPQTKPAPGDTGKKMDNNRRKGIPNQRVHR